MRYVDRLIQKLANDGESRSMGECCEGNLSDMPSVRTDQPQPGGQVPAVPRFPQPAGQWRAEPTGSPFIDGMLGVKKSSSVDRLLKRADMQPRAPVSQAPRRQAPPAPAPANQAPAAQ